MLEINYIQILKDAWKITWKHKFLWWLGLLSGSAGFGMNFPTNSWGNHNDQPKPEDLDKIKGFILSHIELLVYISIGLVFLIIALFVVGIIARGGLIKSIHKINKGEATNFKTGFRDGQLYFWKVLGIGFLTFLLIFLSLIIIITPIIILFANNSYVPAFILLFIGLIIFFFIAITISFMKNYGNIYAVIGNLTLRSSLEKAYDLFRKNFIASIIMGLLFIPVGLILGLGLIILLIPLVLAFFLIGLILYYSVGQTGIVIAVVSGIILFLIISMAIGSVYQTFYQTAWILFFYEIARPKVAQEVAEEIKEKKEPIGEPNPIKTSGIKK